MLWNAKNAEVSIGNTKMPYASFGHGSLIFIILPGLSDGLATVRGKALLLAKPYAPFFDRFTVYMFSRKDEMPSGYTIRAMAADQAEALRQLGIEKASVMGVSQGGMIAQYLVIDHPDLVERLKTVFFTRGKSRYWIRLYANGSEMQQVFDEKVDEKE